MKNRFYILLIFVIFLLFISCSKWDQTYTPTVKYLPDEAGQQGDTIYVDTLSCLHFSYCVYEITGHIQISKNSDFSILLFDSMCNQYNSTNVDLMLTIEIPVDKFQMDTNYYSRVRFLADDYIFYTQEWSNWSPVGYFTLALSAFICVLFLDHTPADRAFADFYTTTDYRSSHTFYYDRSSHL